MNIGITENNGVLTLTLAGRLDTAASLEAMEEIDCRLAAYQRVERLVCDISELTYISSSGLRIMLKLAKQFKDFRIVEACPEVYRVFEMTQFTKIMNVERALRRMSIDGCEMVGRGGIGVVYRIDDDTIIKVFREGTTFEAVQSEVLMAKEAFVLGMPTAISYDVVRVGNQYGLVYELLRATLLSDCVVAEPQQLDRYARLYAQLLRQLHSIEILPGSGIPNFIEHEKTVARRLSRYLDSDSVDLLLHILESIPVGNRLLHGDLQPKNVMMQGDESMLIDMGEVGYGHPMSDLGHCYSAMMTLVGCRYEDVIGMSEEMAHRLFLRTLDYYFEGLPAETIAHRMEQIAVVSKVRGITWLSLSDALPESTIRAAVEAFHERVTKQKDYILGVCETFHDWTL